MITVKQMRKILETVDDENQIICVQSGTNGIFAMPFCTAEAYPVIYIRDRKFRCSFNSDPAAKVASPVVYEVIRKEIK